MKKIIVTILAALTAVAAFAQDLNQATDIYNNAATALNTGDKVSAVTYFTQACEMAKALGKEGEEIVAKCQEIIPTLVLSIAKDEIKAGNHDNAVAKLNEAISVAKAYSSAEIEAEATDLIPQVYMQKGSAMYNAKNFAEAEAAYAKVLEISPSNGMAALRLGMALNQEGKADEAIEAYKKASELGQEKSAGKQIANIYLKKAAGLLKDKAFAGALEAAVASNEYLESAQAYQIAGQASQGLSKSEDAIKYFEKYLEMKPDAKNAGQIAFTVGALYQQAGKKDKAVEFYKKASTDPKYGAEATRLAASLK